MKTILLITVYFFAIKTMAQNANYKITYRHCVQFSSTKKIWDTIGVTAILTGNDKVSNYSFVKKGNTGKDAKAPVPKNPINADEMANKKETGTYQIRIPATSIDSIGNMVFFDKITDSIFVREKTAIEYILTREKAPKINWLITDETKYIKNYKCIKATTHYRGRDYIAWFTPELPLNEGPWKFKGLPGLVMDIVDDKYQVKLYVEKIEFPVTDKPEPFVMDGTLLSLNDYFEYRQKGYIKLSQKMVAMLSVDAPNGKKLSPSANRLDTVYGIEKKND